MDKETYTLIKEKYGKQTSWAIWNDANPMDIYNSGEDSANRV